MGQPLRFERSYNSLPVTGTVVYSRPLGYGWTHNYDINLTLPGDPGGEPGTAILKAPHGSRMRFLDNGDGSYDPYPGVWATMTRQGTSAPFTYVITAANQTVYTFGVLTDALAVEPVWSSPPPDLVLAPDYRVAAAPGAVFSLTHSLTNTGSTTDTYTITVASAGDWAAVEPVTATLAGGASITVTTTASAPQTYGRDALTTAVLTATSWTTPTLTATAAETLTLRGYRLLTIRDPQGNQTQFDYGGSGRLGRVSDAASQRYLDFGYDGQGRLSSVADHTGRGVGYGYDAFDNLTVVTDTRDLAWTYVYTSAGGAPGTGHYLHEVIDPDQRVVERTFFDAEGRAYRQEDGGDQPLVEIKYNLDGTRVVTEAGVVITDTYNAQNLLVGQTDAQGNSQDFTFDSYFNRSSVIDANDNPTAYARNQFGYTRAITDALENTTRFDYDDNNNLTYVKDARDIVTRYFYEDNRLITRTVNYTGNGQYDPDFPDRNVAMVYRYDNEWGLVSSVTDPNEHTTTYGYDSLGQRTVITDALRNATRFEYDDLGRVVTTTAPSIGSGQGLGKVTVNQYDAGDNLVRVTENYLAGQPQNYTPPGPPFEEGNGGVYNLITRYAYDGAGRRTYITDTLNHVTRNEYDAAGRLVTTTVNLVDGSYDPAEPDEDLITTYDYDVSGRLYLAVEHRGVQSRATRTFYDDLGRVEKTVVNYDESLNGGNYDPDYPDRNIATGYEYDANGNQVLVIDTLGRKTKTGYDDLNRPMTVTVNYDPSQPSNPEYNLITTYAYDEVGNQFLVTNPKSQATKYDYDALNRVITVTANYVPPGAPADADTNVKTSYAYDAAGNRTRVTDPNQHITTYDYDALNRVVTTTNPLEGRSVVAYDAVGNRTGVTDARQNQTVYKYDSLYRLAEVRQDYLDGIPEGGPQSGDLVTTFAYDPLGNRLRMTDAESHTTTYGYDALSRVILITNTLEYTLGYSYDAWGDRTAVTDENDHTTTYTYDDLGRVTRIEDSEGITSTYTYDGLGNRLSVTNGENERTRYGYDDLNRLEAITDTLGYVLGYDTRYRYDALGNREFMIDAEGVETRYEYDDLNRLIAVTENYTTSQGSDHETNVRTEYGYDPAGNRRVITNALGYTTVHTYDGLNRLTVTADPLGHTTRYGYDPVGNRTVITDANEAVTRFVYDHVNRLTGIDYPAPEADVTFTYDKVGNRKTMGDGTGTTSYDYDDLYRLESVTDGSGQTVGYTYDPAGNRHTMTYPSGQVITYTYDMANRLDTVTDWDGGVYDYTFDDAHRLAQITMPNAITSTYDYDDAGRLVALTHASAAETLASYAYELDKVGNRQVVTETLLAPVDLGLAMHLLPEERPVLYADGEFLEPGWLGPVYAGLRLPDLAAMEGEGGQAPTGAPEFATGATRNTESEGVAGRGPGLAAISPPLSALPAWQPLRAAWQATVTPTVTATLEIATSTPMAPPPETETPPPEPSSEPTGEVVTATLTATPSPTLEATPVVTPGTGTPPATTTEPATPTSTASGTPEPPAATPTATLTPAPAVTPTPTFTPTPTLAPTFTPTSTPTLIIDELSLEVIPEPATVLPGQAVTVTLRLANAGPGTVHDISLTAFLPPSLAYQASLGEPPPGYDPRLRMLAWGVGTLAPDAALEVGYRAALAPEASPGALTLSAEAGAAGLATSLQASATITIERAVAPTPTPRFELPLAGPPGRIQLAVEPVRDETREGQGQPPGGGEPRPYWLAAYVVDAGGLAVTDGTPVQLGVTGGEAAQTTLRTRGGIATTRLDVPPGRVVTITARAGEASASLAIGEETGEQGATQVGRGDDGYGARARALVAARNAFSRDGAGLAAENRTRRLSLDGPNLDFTLKGQQAGDESLALSFQLTGVTPSPTLPLRGGGSTVRGNRVIYQPPGATWQVVYEAGDATLEQSFLFEKGTPADGDPSLGSPVPAPQMQAGQALVIEGVFNTALQPVFLSDEEGIRFYPAGREAEEAEAAALGYGPARVRDAGGRETLAHMELQGRRLRIVVPADWLARAEFPVLVDPAIGPAELVSELQGAVSEPDAASDGSHFLAVWTWNGDIYGQLVDASGALSGTLIAISQADGVQHYPAVTYNAVSDEYLVIWDDHRYGWTYNNLYGRRLGAGGQLLGEEIEILPPTLDVGYPALAVSGAGDYLAVWQDMASNSRDIHGQMLAAGGALSGTLLVVSDATGGQTEPDVAYDSQADVFLAAWSDRRAGSYDLYGQRVTAGGTLLGSNQALASDGGDDLNWPAVASNGSGQFLAVWQQELSSSDYDLHAIRVAAATGQVVGSVLDVDTGSDKERYPAVTGTGEGEYLVVWEDSGVVEARRVAGDGSLPGSVLVLSAATDGFRSYPAVAHAGSGGQSLGVWTDSSQAAQTILTGRRVADGGSLSGDELFISPYFNLRERAAIAYHEQAGDPSAGSGQALLAWQQAYAAPQPDIFVQRVDGGGQPIGDALNVTDHPAAQERPFLAAGAAGYLAVWQDSRDGATSGGDVYGHLLDASGALSGTLIAISTATGDQFNPAAAYNSRRDEYLVVWDDDRNGTDRDIYGQVVGGDGMLVAGAAFSLTVSGYQGYPDVAYDPDRDRYLAVWEDDRPGTPGTDIYGQVISADGSLLGSDFALSSASDYQYDPVLAYGGASGVYLAAWWDKRDGVQWDIYGQVISGTGVLSGSNFAISSAGGNQEYPDVSVRPAGGSDEFLVVWQDRRASWARDIYAQRVGADGSLLDETDTPADETDPTVNFPLDTSGDYSERPVAAYSPEAEVYLAAWNDRDDGGVYARRYAGAMPPVPAAGFTAAPTGGVVPLTVVFSDTSTGTIAGREWNFGDGEMLSTLSSAPLSHTYVTTGSFSAVLTVTNPAGSDVASTLITVTEQTTPFLVADFEDMDLGVDPLFWLDQKWDTTHRDDFETLWAGDSRALGTQYTGSSTVYSHYAIPGWASWQDYEYTGRMKMDDADSGIGLVVYSRYPAYEEKVYILRRYADTPDTESFHLAASGTSLAGDLQTGVTPQPGTWYRFRVQAATGPERVTVRARVWAEGSAEPGVWQAEAYDESGTRLTAGAVGVRTYGPGSKYFDDLVVTPQRLQAGFSAQPLTGTIPLTVTFTNLSTPTNLITGTLWSYGDGVISNTTALTHPHTYTQAGVYTVSLAVEGPGGSDTLTRPEYITTYRPLTVTGTSPMSNGLVIPQNGVISATFGRAISTSTVSTRTFTVRGSQTGVYVGDYTFGSVRFDAAGEFKPGEEIVVNLSSGIKDLDAAPLTPYVWGMRAATLDGSGIFSDSGQVLGSLTDSALAVALGDLDRDGDLDAFVGNDHDANRVWLNDGAGIFTPTQSLGYNSQAVALGDLDRDGDLDAFLGNDGDASEVWLNDGTGVFTLTQSLGYSDTRAVALGDLDGDGDLDAILAHYGSADQVWLNDGSAGFTLEQSWGDPAYSEAVALGDLDGDGHLDAFLANRWQQANQVWLNDGRGALVPGQSFGSSDSYAIALGDLDGDGDLDAFVRDSETTKVWLNDGVGSFSDSGQSLASVSIWYCAVALGDVDGDGDLDAFLTNHGDVWFEAYNEVWLNDGRGVFSLSYRMADAYSVDVDLGDVDGDGDLDAFVANSDANQVWLNLNRPLLATISAYPRSVMVGQPIQVSMRVTNINAVPIEDVRPWLLPNETYRVSGPQPVSASLEAAGSVTFTWVYTASGSSTVTWQGGASGMDVTAGITATSPTTLSNAVAVIGTGLDWVQREPASSPPVRGGHAMAYDSARGETVLFGGRNETGFLSDTWEYRGSGGWVQANPEHTPPAHWEHAMAYDSAREVTVLFGGYNAGSGLLSDTWEYDGTDWSQVISPTVTPPARRSHAMAYDSARGVVVLFGGYNAGSGLLSDTWEYDGEWIPVSTSHRPPACAGHAMVYDSVRQVTVLFDGDSDCEDMGTWEYDGSDWVHSVTDPDLWNRSEASMAYDSRREAAVLFGGITLVADTDTWEYDGAWTEVNTDHWPPGRTAHAMAYDSKRGQVVLLGGGTGGANGYRADTWEYGVFTQAVTAGFSASPLIGTAPLTVTFSDQSGGAVDSLHWDYGDGATSTTSALTHTYSYTQLGTYTVTLTVNGLGGSDAQTATIRVVSQTYTTTTRVITYTYDPLYRLTDADYSTGEAFAYAYDAVGNRTVHTRTLTATTVITYAYDAANRLVNVDGVDYTWDANGNLLSDGVRTLAYDAANRLTSVTSGTLTTTFEYDGLGNRTSQTVNGLTTDYVLDVASGLPEVIVATTGGSSIYYVQVQGQVLAQQESGAWAYVLPDHLGSVRQLIGSDRQVDLAQSFDPFGVPFETSGSGVSEFGYTGEWWDSYTGLVFLRARYYGSAVGRFLAKDPWPGDVQRPQTLNGWGYAEGNPVNLTDPSGFSPPPPHPVGGGLGAFLECFALSVRTGLYTSLIDPSITVQDAIATCQMAYSQTSWWQNETNCQRRRDAEWSLPQTVGELFEDYLCERGPEHVRFPGRNPLTRQLAESAQLDILRSKFYREGEKPISGEQRFNFPEVFNATVDALMIQDVSITHFLGTFDYSVSSSTLERVGFWVQNQTDRASGSHFAGRFPAEGYIWSLEELVEMFPHLKRKSLKEVVTDYNVISVLRAQPREETRGSIGGGNMKQTFTWSERRLVCPEETFSKYPWPLYLNFLDIDEWPKGYFGPFPPRG